MLVVGVEAIEKKSFIRTVLLCHRHALTNHKHHRHEAILPPRPAVDFEAERVARLKGRMEASRKAKTIETTTRKW